MKWFIIFLAVSIGIIAYLCSGLKENTVKNSLSGTPEFPTKIPSSQKLIEPIAGFRQRMTKKPFGVYVTPQNSPVKPERFTGYHTGADAEYQDVTTNVPVVSIADGYVVFSGYVNGYGGVVVIQHHINNSGILALYGHLKPSSLIRNKIPVTVGQQIGVLGKGYSTETDGERKHLHLGLINGSKIDFRGYVQNKNELSQWTDPLNLFK